jgi:hypothetical protein
MGRDEVDEEGLLCLRGIERISRTSLVGRCFLNFGGFATASEWAAHFVSVANPYDVQLSASIAIPAQSQELLLSVFPLFNF